MLFLKSVKIYSFPPLITQGVWVLILGSMPSVQSLRSGQYYGHPRNHFWPMLFSLCQEPYQDSYDSKKDLLMRYRIGLWDVMASCVRPGSLDHSIREAVPNDIPWLLAQCPCLQTVAFNGKKAQDTFDRHFSRSGYPGITFVELPSSSPIPTKKARNMEEKQQLWRVLQRHILQA